MADIILPDDVFENMQHAQEAAEKMNAAVNDFNKKVDEKFKGEDASNKAKFKQKINPILSPDEKKRYRNIGNAFFEGAKNQIVDIFKQIEENKKKRLFSRATGAVKEKIESIKEATEEKNTGKKILLAIAAIGGIYMLFKGWFDENMPGIWEKMKEAVVSFANSAVSLAEEISKAVANSEIFENIKNFVTKTGDTIVKFFEDIGKTLTGLFSSSNESSAERISYSDKDVKENQKLVDEIEKRKKDDPLFKLISERFTDLDNALDKKTRYLSEIYDLRQLEKKGFSTIKDKNGNTISIAKRIEDLQDGVNKQQGIIDEALPKIEEQLRYYTPSRNEIIRTANDKDSFGRQLSEKLKANNGVINDEIREFMKNSPIFKNLKSKKEENKGFFSDRPSNTPEMDIMINDVNTHRNNDLLDAMIKDIANHSGEVIANDGKTPEEIEKERKKEATRLQAQREDNERRIQNVNYAKLTHVAVITSLDEFVRNFFDGNKPGSFKHFSNAFLELITQIADNFKIATTIIEHINSLHNKVDSLVDKVKKNLETIVEALNNDTQSVKNFISEKFEENNISYLSDMLQDIISKEQEQIDCLVEQNKILKETNTLLSNVATKNNSFNIINPQNGDNNIDVSNTPNANLISIANAFVTGETPYNV